MNTEETNHAIGCQYSLIQDSVEVFASTKAFAEFPFAFQCRVCPCTCLEQWQLINNQYGSILSIIFLGPLTGTES